MQWTMLTPVAILFIGQVAFAAPDNAMPRLLKARGLKCEFGPGVFAEWKDGGIKVGSGSFGKSGGKGTIHYDSINLHAGTARVIGGAGSSDMNVGAGGVGITLIENVPMGGVAVTTVFGTYDSDGGFPAVLSKHVDLLGPFPQQYYGSCRIWE